MRRGLVLCCGWIVALGAGSPMAQANSAGLASVAATPEAPAGGEASRWRPDLRISTAFSDESTGFQRTTTSSLAEFTPGPATKLRLQPLHTHFRQDGNQGQRPRKAGSTPHVTAPLDHRVKNPTSIHGSCSAR